MPFYLETARLQIRPWTAAERPTFERFVADAEVTRYISHDRVWNGAAVEAYLERQARNLARHGCCVGGVASRESSAIVGMGGIQPLESAGVFELAWSLRKDYWNRGLATEMARGLRDYAFGVLQLTQVVAVMDPLNRASVRVAEKLGMRCAGMRNAHDLAERHPDMEVLYFVLERQPQT